MPTIFDGVAANALTLLSAGRGYFKGIGLSRNARILNDQFLNQSKSGLNTLLSLGVSGNATIENVQLKIKALRASVPQSQILESLRDNGNAAANPNGTNVNEEV